jgi:hypothetical protein
VNGLRVTVEATGIEPFVMNYESYRPILSPELDSMIEQLRRRLMVELVIKPQTIWTDGFGRPVLVTGVEANNVLVEHENAPGFTTRIDVSRFASEYRYHSDLS